MPLISTRALVVIGVALGAIALSAFVIKPALDGSDDKKKSGEPSVQAPGRTASTASPADASAQPLIEVLPEAKRAFIARTGPKTQLLKVTLDGREGHIRFAYRKGQTSDGAGLIYRPAGGFTAYDVRINAGPKGFDVFELAQLHPEVVPKLLARIHAKDPKFDPAVLVLAPQLSEHLLYWDMTDGRTRWRALGDGVGEVHRVG